MSQCPLKIDVLKAIKVKTGHGAYYLVTPCIFPACISAQPLSMFLDISIHIFQPGIMTPSCLRVLWEPVLELGCQSVVMDLRLTVSWC